MSLIRLEGVGREVGALTILDHLDGAIAIGDRIGLVGPNGAGKTTLLRVVAGVDEPDQGIVTRKRGLTLGLLAQEAHVDAAFVESPDLRTAVRRGAAALERMERELAELEQAHRVTGQHYAELQHRFDALGGYTLDQRVDAALSGLGFERDQWARPPTGLSGGEQTRAALARLVVADPELLLLDEPTNHLDLAALEWLEEQLRRRHGSLLIASHDRAFLDATVERVWELRDRRLQVFRGNYSAYARQRQERDGRLAKEMVATEGDIARERELIQRYRSHRKFAKMHEHEARLESIQRIEAPGRAKRLRLPSRALVGGGPARSAELVIRMEELVVGYPGKAAGGSAPAPAPAPASDVAQAPASGAAQAAVGGQAPTPADAPPVVVARVPFLELRRGERVGIVGPNGAGKTTLLRTIAGDLAPLDGHLELGGRLQLGYLAQLRGAGIPGATVLEAILDAMPVTPGEARGYLARFLFQGDDVFKEVRALSGGERSRLELALLGLLPSNLLLLDEPTNHLDIPAREAIESFLRDAEASLLVVSHDRRLLETVCESLWVVDQGQVAQFEGGYRQWRAAVAEGWTVAGAIEQERRRLRPGDGHRRASSTRLSGARPTVPRPNVAPTNGSRSGGLQALEPAAVGGGPGERRTRVRIESKPPRPKLSKDVYRRQKASVEGELTRLGLRKSHLELAMSDPAVAANFVELRRITSELADVELGLAAAEEAWLDLEERAP